MPTLTEKYRHKLERRLPRVVRQQFKKFYWKMIRLYNQCAHLKKDERVEIGARFRFSRSAPFTGFIGKNSIIEEFNVWNVKAGDIAIGQECWFGLHNILMGPLEIGDRVSTGPHVSILGPRHAKIEPGDRVRTKTIIGNNVWISTGAIIQFGVKIGDDAIIGPGSVVARDVPANSYVCGNPARDLTKLAHKIWTN